MTDLLKEQLSAFIDGALSGAESEWLLRRLCAEATLSRHAGRYWLIGEALRESGKMTVCGPSRLFAERVCAAIAAESPPRTFATASSAPADMSSDVLISPTAFDGASIRSQGRVHAAGTGPGSVRPGGTTPVKSQWHWLRRTAGLAAAASIGAVTVLVWQAWQVSQAPVQSVLAVAQTARPAPDAGTASGMVGARLRPGNQESAEFSQTAAADKTSSRGMSAPQRIFMEPSPAETGTRQVFFSSHSPRLANYVMVHSEYSSPLGRRAMLSGILAEGNDVGDMQDVTYVERAH